MPIITVPVLGTGRQRPSDFFTCICAKDILQNSALPCTSVSWYLTMVYHTFNICTRRNFWWILNVDFFFFLVRKIVTELTSVASLPLFCGWDTPRALLDEWCVGPCPGI